MEVPDPPATAISAEAPRVSLIVAMRDEAGSIGRCIASIAEQRYPADLIEVFFYDGGSSDGTKQIVAEAIAGRPTWRLLDNPRRIQASAWNLGIDAASGEVIGIVSGHAELGPGYVAEAVETLRRTGADMVGGPVRAVGDGLIGSAIALAVSTPFGVGGATFRYLDREADVDTVFMGICRSETYRRFRFDEEMVRDQDDELSYRILDAGGRIVCDPAIASSYRSRSSIAGLWRQYVDYGYWKVRVIAKHPGQLRIRQLVPSAFLGSLTAGVLIGVVWRPAALGARAIAGAYLVTNVAATVHVGRKTSAGVALALPLVFSTMHVGYGVGMLAGASRAGLASVRRRLGMAGARPL